VKPLEIVYWLRLGFGILAALVCIGYGLAEKAISSTQFSTNLLLDSISLAIIVYVLSYYVLKGIFRFKVQKTQKLLTTGIGIYFLSWITFYALLYTALAPAPPSPASSLVCFLFEEVFHRCLIVGVQGLRALF
jgi:hypothetical protein